LYLCLLVFKTGRKKPTKSVVPPSQGGKKEKHKGGVVCCVRKNHEARHVRKREMGQTK